MVQSKALLELEQSDAAWAGSKAMRLGRLGQGGFAVPAGLAIGADAYRRFVEETAILTSIQLMMHRKRTCAGRSFGTWRCGCATCSSAPPCPRVCAKS
ncbi:MAG: hypothetical protein JW940_34830 [Polyangiaceae bacterium]|nr:hypothetical protein [Polyangiaceae bacterium]